MQNRLSLDSDFVIDLKDRELEPEDSNGYEVVLYENCGEWRWGVKVELIIKDSEGRYWRTEYREQPGDNYYVSLEDTPQTEFEEVEPYEVSVTKYRSKHVS